MINKTNLTILFFLRQDRTNRHNLTPIFCRITLDRERYSFGTRLFVVLEEWDSKKQTVNSKSPEAIQVNKQLGLMKLGINEAYMNLVVSGKPFTANDIYQLYSGKNKTVDKATILQLFEEHNAKMKRLVGKEYTKATWGKFEEVKGKLKAFIKAKYKRNDYLLSDLNIAFLNEFIYYLKTKYENKQITINKAIQRLRKIVKLAISEGLLIKDPFASYKPAKVDINVVFLTTEELAQLERYNFNQNRLIEVRDCYVFCCYTGLAYQEMSILKKEHIIKGFDGNLWIEMYRKKTGKDFSVPLLPKAISIIEKYKSDNRDTLLPVVSNQKFNSYIKEIAEILGVNKRLTHHTARKTFASTVLLYNDVPIEVVSELLGHSKITITQEHYGRVVKKKVSEVMANLRQKID